MDKEFAPLSSTCIRNLQDKLYDKRKLGALEVEKLVRDANAAGATNRIDEILRIMTSEFLISTNCHCRKGGLIGLASVAIGLGRNAQYYAEPLAGPVIRTLSDPDSRVKYYACESLYNIIKILKSDCLPLFNDIFDGLSKCIADEDSSVRKGCTQLDRLMKDLVADNARQFHLSTFIPFLRERIYTKNMHTRQFLVAWLDHLLLVPQLYVAQYTADLLDGLFCILKDSRTDLSQGTESLLEKLLTALENLPPGLQPIPYANMTQLLIVHCKWAGSSVSSSGFMGPGGAVMADPNIVTHYQATDPASILVQCTALFWIKTFLERVGVQLLPQASSIVSALLPCLAGRDEEDKRPIYNTARLANEVLMKLVESMTDQPAAMSNSAPSSTTSLIRKTSQDHGDRDVEALKLSDNVVDDMNFTDKRQLNRLNVSEFMNVVSYQLANFNEATCLATLRWISILLKVRPDESFSHWKELIPLLLKSLVDASAEVILWTLKVVSQLCLNPRSYTESVRTHIQQSAEICQNMFKSCNDNDNDFLNSCPLLLYFMAQLLQLFDSDENLLSSRGDVIVSMLCSELGADKIYRLTAEIILSMSPDDYLLASTLVKSFNRFLLTQSSLHPLRKALRCLDTEDRCQLFCRLYCAWCYHPVSLLSLCLLTQSYEHTSTLVKYFGCIELSVDVLCEMDRLVQLIESPLFAFVRLHLLDPKHSPHLQQTLYSLLMCLPQTEAFLILRRRLDCVPQQLMNLPEVLLREEEQDHNFVNQHVKFNELLSFFRQVQDSAQERRLQRLQREKLDIAYRSKLPPSMGP